MKTLFCESLKTCNIFYEEQLHLKDCPFTFTTVCYYYYRNSFWRYTVIILNLVMLCERIYSCERIKVLLNKAYQCVVRRQLFSRSSQQEFSPARSQDGVSSWEMAKAGKVSLWKAVPLLKALNCTKQLGGAQRHEIIAKVSNNSSGGEHDSKSKYIILGDLSSWYAI